MKVAHKTTLRGPAYVSGEELEAVITHGMSPSSSRVGLFEARCRSPGAKTDRASSVFPETCPGGVSLQTRGKHRYCAPSRFDYGALQAKTSDALESGMALSRRAAEHASCFCIWMLYFAVWTS